MNNTRLIVLSVFVASFVWAAVADAMSWSHSRESVRFSAVAIFQSNVSLDQAVAMVQAKYGAKSVRAATVDFNGRLVHEIRLRSADGSRVWTVQVDAASGREL